MRIRRGQECRPHHQRRHRHRDKQHRRAMQQVAAWIQREHSVSPTSDPTVNPATVNGTLAGVVNGAAATSPVAINAHTEHVAANGIVNNMAAATVPGAVNMNTSRVVGTKMVATENGKSLVRPVFGPATAEHVMIQRHEHHHIHEHHHHHHYHHYHET